MIIKSGKKDSNWGPRIIIAVLLLFIAALVIYLLPMTLVVMSDRLSMHFISMTYPGLHARCGYLEGSCGQNLHSAVRTTISSQLADLFGSTKRPRFNINVNFDSWETIKKARADAMQRGYLESSDQDFVKGTIDYAGRAYPVKLRLKGLHLDHLDDAKMWSVRVHVNDDEAILGMRRFSLQHPKTRDYQYEPIYLDMARDLGLMAPRYMFVDVSINGERIGTMALEEYFSKELIESHGRREGVLMKFDSDTYVHGGIGLQRMYDSTDTARIRRNYCDNFFTADVVPYRSDSVAADPDLTRQRDVGISLLRSFADGEQEASDVFAVEKTAGFIANAMAWNSYHNLHWMNLRFYLDPITLKLEPIASDAGLATIHELPKIDWRMPPDNSGALIHHDTIADTFAMDFIRLLLADPEIMGETLSILKRYETNISRGGVIPDYREQEERYLRQLQPAYPFLPPAVFSAWENLEETIELIGQIDLQTKDDLGPLRDGEVFFLPRLPKYINAHVIADGSGVELEFVNILNSDILIDGIQVNVNGETHPITDYSDNIFPLLLERTGDCTRPNSAVIQLNDIAFTDSIEVTGNVRISAESTDNVYPFIATPYAAPSVAHALTPLADDELRMFPFLSVSKDKQNIKVKAGQWQVNRFLTLPEGFGLEIGPDTTMTFAPEAGMVVNGRLQIDGPVVMRASNTDWKGLTVLRANGFDDRPSFVRGLEIHDTTFAEHDDWKITGGMTFYESDVEMEDCRIVGSRAEDALNIIRSDFTLDGVTIEDTLSDGLDADFASGRIAESTFSDIQGDGVDFSGSDITLAKSSFNGIGDKAVSVGEKSTVDAEDISINSATFGFVSKDGSLLKVTNSNLEGIDRYVLAAYIKKTEYGSATLQADGITYQEDLYDKVVAQEGSILHIDGEQVPDQALDVEALYQTD
ncbi:MAG: CotH kinase family protein [Patescibacteria group bacterium]|nr:CotH kinase family protein [Patescibacteria group bacterium]